MVMVKDQKIQRLDGSVGTARVVPLADSELDGLDILTWPAYSPIWPVLDNKESEDVHSEWFDLSAFNNLFSIQGGLINFNLNFRFSSTNVDEQEQWIFDLENGDDWFYFEDNYSQSSLAKSVDAPAPPFTISTISGTETEVIRLRFKTQPQHKVLHKGACSFSGIRVPEQGSRMPISRVRNSLVHQYRQDA
ncbi:hypothetical protein H2198_006214 [Neophaeococcomyces mojaviensis]|uniref:Uncharacterized protein n=1 Tax=Neophaeococcomyces mojaviensis TaxID=3383035 RepID=A0ACC3A3J2_9EURO|nr:hypothetical protein H2198_006214 [Knufia sp. JES_112]